jgi:ABC-type bacteriocin/lantibiotic exporter with double-glycine peptidase domain
VRVLWRMFRGNILVAGIQRFFMEAVSVAWPPIFYVLIRCTQRGDDGKYMYPDRVMYIVVAVLFVLSAYHPFVKYYYTYYCYRVGMRLRSTVIMAVYRKALTLSGLSRHKFPPGVIINHMAVDPTTLVELVPNFHLMWAIPFEIVAFLAALVYGVGWAGLTGLVVVIFIIPVNIVIGGRLLPIRIGLLGEKDTRIKLLTEVLNSIKTVKLMVWEAHLHGELNDARRREVGYLFKFIFARSLILIALWAIPLLAQLAVFLTLIAMGRRSLSISEAFLPAVVFGQLNGTLSGIPKFVNDFVVCLSSLKRITAFLLTDEVDFSNVEQHEWNSQAPAIVAQNASFVWEDTGEVALDSLNFTIHPGQLVAVIGQVGSGKSALLRALLGTVKRAKGRVEINGRIAYAAQSSWIQNISLRDNITFGKQFNPEWYEKVVRACELKRDIAILTGGDTAEIGEAGSTLSGGQK